jgi:hypothetical protein
MDVGLGRIADVDRLRSTWAEVLASDREDGVLAAGVARFAEDAEARLEDLAAELASGDSTCRGSSPGWSCCARTARCGCCRCHRYGTGSWSGRSWRS